MIKLKIGDRVRYTYYNKQVTFKIVSLDFGEPNAEVIEENQVEPFYHLGNKFVITPKTFNSYSNNNNSTLIILKDEVSDETCEEEIIL